MNTIEFLGHLRGLGVSLTADGGSLRCQAPQGVLTPALVAELRQRKAEVLPYFIHEPSHNVLIAIPRVSRNGELPLSFGQQQMWFMDRLSPGSSAYNICAAASLTGPLSVNALQQSLTTIVERHEVLRTVFRDIDGRAVQVIQPPADVPFLRIDLTGNNAEREEQVQRLAQEYARKPFDLCHGPLFRAELIRLDSARHVLLVAMHHTVADGWSMGILVRELATAYSAFVKGQRPSLPDLPTQYADYAVWQRQRLQGATLERLEGYWRQQLAGGVSALPLGNGRTRPAAPADRGAKCSLMFSESLTHGLLALSRREGTTLFMTLMSAIHVLLARYTGERDISVGFPIANRTHPQIEPLIGFFANTLVLRQDMGGNPPFSELLRHVREVALDAFTYQDLPFDHLAEILRVERNLGSNPLFQVMFALQSVWMPSIEFCGVKLSPIEIDNQTAKFDLNIHLSESAGILKGWIQYRESLFGPQDISRMAAHICTLLEGIVANPQGRIHSLPILTEDERRHLVAVRGITAPPPRGCVHERFEIQAGRTPDRIAVVSNGTRLTYRELNRLATALAARLRALGVGPNVPVAIYLERSVDMVTAILATLKAGGAYLPLDPMLPRERVEFMLADAKARVALAHSSLITLLPTHGPQIVCLDTERGEIDNAEPGSSPVSPDDIAYLIYTSGSTGAPKAVAISHQSVLNLICGLQDAVYADLGSFPLAIGLNGPLAFDTSVKQIVQITQGHTLHILPDALRADPQALLLRLREQPLDVLDCTPSQLRLLVEAGLLEDQRLDSMAVLVGGEPIDAALWDRLAAASDRRFFNLYGPTECTVDATACRVETQGSQPTIGRPLANVRAYVLDPHLQVVPMGILGELYLGGAGVGRGYYNRPAATAEAFIPDPFATEDGARMYRTRDVVRWLPTDNLEFIGRFDRLAKVRGHRVELQEVEQALRRHPGIAQAAAIMREETLGYARLLAYVVPSSDVTPSSPELRRFLKEILPQYMVPAEFVSLKALPMNQSGKTDYRALPAPGIALVEQRESVIAPRDLFELELVGIWQDLLRVRPIGVTDNFFELGGHSILALSMVAKIKQRLGRELPLSALFQTGTIEQLAEVLRQSKMSERWSALVAIQSGGSNEPFFCVHPVGGNVLSYLDLADALGPEQPFYGLQAEPVDHEGDTRSIEMMASRYLDEVRKVKARGPYRLLGWSMGGVVAFEMARQLAAAGEQTTLLGLLDTRAPGWPRKARKVSEQDMLTRFASDLAGRAGTEAPFRAAIRSVSTAEGIRRLLEVAVQYGVLPRDLSVEQLQLMLATFSMNLQAVRDYKSRAACLHVTLIQSEATAARDADPTMGWNALAKQGVTHHLVPGDHYSIMRRPDVHAVARILNASLEEEPAGHERPQVMSREVATAASIM